MATPGRPAEKQGRSRAVAIVVMESLKALHVMVVSVMADLTAVRRTLLSDPALLREYENQLNSAHATAKPLLDEAMKSYDARLESAFGTGKPRKKPHKRRR
jgi:hypothetical protein